MYSRLSLSLPLSLPLSPLLSIPFSPLSTDNFLLPLFIYMADSPNSLRAIYKLLEIPKPTKLKKPKTSHHLHPLLFPLPTTSTTTSTTSSSTPSSTSSDPLQPTTKKRKVEEVKDSKLSELLNTKFQAKSLNHFSSGLSNVKALLGKQVKAQSQTTSPARAGRARARQDAKTKKEWKNV